VNIGAVARKAGKDEDGEGTDATEMAAITGTTFQRMLKALRENNVKEKREALTYITR